MVSGRFLKKFALIVGYIFLWSETLGGLIRYIFGLLNIPFLIYIPKILLFVGMIGLLFLSLYRLKLGVTYVITVSFMMFSLMVGIIYVRDMYQILFGFWAIMPFFYGILIAESLGNLTFKPIYFYSLWVVVIIGIAVTLILDVPWVGFAYNLGDFSLRASREWWTFGIPRISGFARASFEAAIQVLILSIFLLYIENRLSVRVFIWLFSGVFISLTTTKTVLAIWIIISLYFLTRVLLRRNVIFAGRILIAFVTVLVVMMPYLANMFFPLEFENSLSRFLFLSFQDRAINIWPAVFELISERGSILLGRGLGGIGAAQMYYEISYLPADNLALYLYSIGGILGVLLLIGYGLGCSIEYRNESKISVLMFVLTLSVLLEGFTVNVLESPYFSLIFGITFSFWYNKIIKKILSLSRAFASNQSRGIRS